MKLCVEALQPTSVKQYTFKITKGGGEIKIRRKVFQRYELFYNICLLIYYFKTRVQDQEIQY